MELLKILCEISFYHKEPERIYYNKYRPMFKIREDMFNDGQIEFIGKEFAFSGEKGIKAYISFARGDLVNEYLNEGKVFTFGEGPNTLGEFIFIKEE